MTHEQLFMARSQFHLSFYFNHPRKSWSVHGKATHVLQCERIASRDINKPKMCELKSRFVKCLSPASAGTFQSLQFQSPTDAHFALNCTCRLSFLTFGEVTKGIYVATAVVLDLKSCPTNSWTIPVSNVKLPQPNYMSDSHGLV
jgi:hypothetical protein